MSDLRVNGVIMDRSEWAKHQGYVRGKADVLAKVRELRAYIVGNQNLADPDDQWFHTETAIAELDRLFPELKEAR